MHNYALFANSGCVEGDIRLVGGTSALEGRVELCRGFLWGTVCDSNWNAVDARVVCRQLGHSTAGIFMLT